MSTDTHTHTHPQKRNSPLLRRKLKATDCTVRSKAKQKETVRETCKLRGTTQRVWELVGAGERRKMKKSRAR